jgi:hypothetical protein
MGFFSMLNGREVPKIALTPAAAIKRIPPEFIAEINAIKAGISINKGATREDAILLQNKAEDIDVWLRGNNLSVEGGGEGIVDTIILGSVTNMEEQNNIKSPVAPSGRASIPSSDSQKPPALSEEDQMQLQEKLRKADEDFAKGMVAKLNDIPNPVVQTRPTPAEMLPDDLKHQIPDHRLEKELQ